MGFKWTTHTGETVRFVLKPMTCGVDSIARPLLQNMMQFNGYNGCSWCYSRGVHKHGTMRYLLQEIEQHDRTHARYLTDMNNAKKQVDNLLQEQNTKRTGRKKFCGVNGIKGFSVLTELEDFDMIWGFSRDYLHADLLGIGPLLWTIWTDRKSLIQLSKTQQSDVNCTAHENNSSRDSQARTSNYNGKK